MGVCPVCNPAKVSGLAYKVAKNPEEVVTLNVHELYESMKKIREEGMEEGYRKAKSE